MQSSLSSKLHVGIVMDGNGRWALGRGGEKRLSDFLLWESAYAELHFTETMWPDFGAEHLAEAVTSFRGRERRFGGLSTCAAAA